MHAAPPARPHAIIDWRCSRQIPQSYYVLHLHAATKHRACLRALAALQPHDTCGPLVALTVLARTRADFVSCEGSMLRYCSTARAMCFLWSPVGLTCLSFASQQYAALLPASVHGRRNGQHGLDRDAPPVSLAHPVCSSTLSTSFYQSSDPTRPSDCLSLPIWSALGSHCGVSELGNCDLMDLRMSA